MLLLVLIWIFARRDLQLHGRQRRWKSCHWPRDQGAGKAREQWQRAVSSWRLHEELRVLDDGGTPVAGQQPEVQ